MQKGLAPIIIVLLIALGIAGYLILSSKNSPIQKQTPSDLSVSIPHTNSSSILYIYQNNTPHVSKLYKSDINNQTKEEIDSEYKGGYTFATSPDGKYLARSNDFKIEVASVEDLKSFKTIAQVETTNNDTRLSDLVWSSDSSKIAYEIVKNAGYSNEPSLEISLYVIDKDGDNKKLIKQFRQSYGIQLKGFNSLKNEIYWIEFGHGDERGLNFTVVSSMDGSTKEIKKELIFPTRASLNLAPDFSKAYYISDNEIIEYTLANNSKRVIYKLDNTGYDGHNNRSYISSLKLSPDGNLLAFAKTVEPDDKVITLSLNLSNGHIETLLDNPKYYNIEPAHWSPDSRYLWLQTWCHGCGLESGYDNSGEYYILDTKTKNIRLFFKSTQQTKDDLGVERVVNNENINLVGWFDN